jgi:phenylpyruvate tautomerase PptA (4-oxalocrotonate tautomerase family)
MIPDCLMFAAPNCIGVLPRRAIRDLHDNPVSRVSKMHTPNNSISTPKSRWSVKYLCICFYLSLCLERMPLYEVEYSIPLTKTHKDDLAAAITKIHHLAYGIPSFFISVKFTDGSKNENYSGGKIVSYLLISILGTNE